MSNTEILNLKLQLGNYGLQPLYKHDCDECIFLGNFFNADHDSGKFDLYYCPGNTLIARYSNEGADYSSGFIFAKHSLVDKEYTFPLFEALRRAIEFDLIGFHDIETKKYLRG